MIYGIHPNLSQGFKFLALDEDAAGRAGRGRAKIAKEGGNYACNTLFYMRPSISAPSLL